MFAPDSDQNPKDGLSDADGDGLPDPGENPIFPVWGREYYLTREPWFDVKPSE